MRVASQSHDKTKLTTNGLGFSRDEKTRKWKEILIKPSKISESSSETDYSDQEFWKCLLHEIVQSVVCVDLKHSDLISRWIVVQCCSFTSFLSMASSCAWHRRAYLNDKNYPRDVIFTTEALLQKMLPLLWIEGRECLVAAANKRMEITSLGILIFSVISVKHRCQALSWIDIPLKVSICLFL